MKDFWQDLRQGARVLLKSPSFSVVAVLSLALGIGANTTIFTVVNAILLDPLPVKDISQLVQVDTIDAKTHVGFARATKLGLSIGRGRCKRSRISAAERGTHGNKLLPGDSTDVERGRGAPADKWANGQRKLF